MPALLGGSAVFDEPLAFAKPTLEDADPVLRLIDQSLRSGRLTDGPLVRELEERIAEAFGIGQCVAVSSCTAGLMLVLQALQPEGPVLVPSFTFSATAHAVRWNGLPLVFADCRPDSWCLGAEDVHGRPAVILATHVSGVPCDVAGLTEAAGARSAKLIFDAAHGAGARVPASDGPRPLGGFGLAEVFSLTPTKVLSGAEGGLVTTNDPALAEHLRNARNYGNPGDYDTRFAGLNARLSEPHAAMALVALDHLEDRVSHRNRVAAAYRGALAGLPGIDFQEVPPGSRSSYKDFTILLDADRFGSSRRAVLAALQAEAIETRCYYSPPVHRQAAYADVETPELPVTARLGSQVISLPMWSHLPVQAAERVGHAFHRIHARADEIEAAVRPLLPSG